MASYQKRGDNSYLLVIEVGYKPNGRRNKKTRTVQVDRRKLNTNKKVTDFLDYELVKFKMEIEAGEYIAPGKLLMKDFVEDWRSKYAKNNLAEQTLDVYLGHLRNHILPYFGHTKIDQLKPMHVVNFLKHLEDDTDISPSTIKYVYRVLRNVMQRATDWELVSKNVVAAVQKPKETKRKKVSVYEPQEVQQLFESAVDQPKHWQLFLSLALACALRRGELLGLEWRNIDFEEATLEVEQVISRGEKGRPVLKEPKSESSQRVISLPKSVLVELKAFRTYWMKEKLKAGELWEENEHEFIFCNENGRHFYPTTPTTWWRRFIKKVEVRYIRLHDLRHTSATTLINQGIHAKIISERLGHSDIRITMNTYGHQLRSADQEAANKFDEVFYNQKNS